MVACRWVAEEVMCWYLKEKDIVVSLYLLAMLIFPMRAVNVTRLIRAYVKDHPLRNGASGTDAFQSPGLKQTASKLDFRTGKPAQVLSLMDAHVVNNERSYLFKLDTEDCGHYIL